MKVRFATQLMSRTVANAIDTCRILKIPGFEGSEATATFIRNMNMIFDLQNSSSKFAFDIKGPVNPETFSLMDDLSKYISSIQDSRGKLILNSLKTNPTSKSNFN